MAYETRLQGVSGDKISGGWHPWPIFAPLPTSINYIYTRCLKLTPDSPIHFTRIPLYPYLSGRMLPVIFTACLLPLEYRGEIGSYWFRYRVHSFSFHSVHLSFFPLQCSSIEWFQRYVLFSIFSRRCFISQTLFARPFLKKTWLVQKNDKIIYIYFSSIYNESWFF